jgi:hypothetical protein
MHSVDGWSKDVHQNMLVSVQLFAMNIVDLVSVNALLRE